jgi:Na+/phosphate symporter
MARTHMGSTVILDLMGGVALLLWGLHMVHSGVARAFGADLRRLLGIALQSRLRAFLAGAFVTALLQSSTATGLMTASFVTGGTVDLVPLDLDILRDLKRVHSHLCSAAYPVLERAGALQRSRLKDPTFGRRKAPVQRLPSKPPVP